MTNHKDLLRLTHFVCISLSTAGSRPQLEQAFKRFMSDAVAIEAGVESEMLVPPARLHVPLGSLSLPTPTRVTAAVEHLRHLDIIKLYDSCLGRSKSQDVRQELLKQPEIVVKIQGVEITVATPID